MLPSTIRLDRCFTLLPLLALFACNGGSPTPTPGTPTPSTPLPTVPTEPTDCVVLDAPVDADLDVDGCLRVDGEIDVNARLRLAAGTVVTVAESGGLWIATGGALVSEGTEEAPVRFQGSSATAGWWHGIAVAGPSSSLRWTEIAHAGEGSATLTVGGALTVEALTLKEGAGVGLRIEGGGSLDATDLQVQSHPGPLASVALLHAPGLIPGLDAGSNASPWVELRAENLDADAVIPALGLPYRLMGTVDVYGALELSAGTQIDVVANGALWIGDTGSLRALGTETEPVQLVGVAGQGSWYGVVVASTNPQNLLRNTVISGAGSAPFYASAAASVAVTNQASLSVDGLTLVDGEGLGLLAESDASLPSVEGLAISEHLGALASIAPDHLGAFSGDLDDTTNAKPWVEVRGGILNVDATVEALDVPYRLDGSMDVLTGLTLEPGVVIEVVADGALWFDGTSRLRALGTAADPIVFRGVAGPSSWRGLVFHSTDPTTLIEHVRLEGAGTTAYYADRPTSMFFYDGTRGRVANTVFVDGANTCIDFASGAQVTLEANQYTGCAGGSLSLPPGRLDAADLASTFGGPVHVRGGSINASVSMAGISVPYRVAGNVEVYDGVLSVLAGAELTFTPDTALWVGNTAGLRVLGTASDPIMLRSTSNLPAGWNGVVIDSPDPANLIEHATLRDGGGAAYYCGGEANLCVASDTSRLTVRDTEISHSAGWGVYAPVGTVTLTNVTYVNNVTDLELP